MLYIILLIIFIYVVTKIFKSDDKEPTHRPAPQQTHEGIEEHYKKASAQAKARSGIDPRIFLTSYVAIDVETTGLDRWHDKITQIALVRVINDTIVDTYTSYIYPGIDISEEVTKITGITNDTVKCSPAFYQIEDRILEFIGNSILVGHNIGFDLDFIGHALGDDLSNPRMDTLRLARKYLHSKDYKLGTLCSSLGVELDNAHDALADCKATVGLFTAIKQRLASSNLTVDPDIIERDVFINHYTVPKKDYIVQESDNKLNGDNYVIFGSIPGYRLRQIYQRILCLGGDFSHKVAQKTKYLVQGDKLTLLDKEATDRAIRENPNIEIISAEELLKRLELPAK